VSAAFRQALALYDIARADALEPVESDAEASLLGLAHSEATISLLRTPAPDLAALSVKLEIFAVEDYFGLSPEYRDPIFGSLAADAWRLAAEGKGFKASSAQITEWKARRDVDRR
jgi:hypothetical protein